MRTEREARGFATSALWHDIECGAYEADLGIWEALAAQRDGPILDIGCGTGRVSLHLARQGHEVRGIDTDPSLVSAFNERATGLSAVAVVADAREFELDPPFSLAMAPMQLLQLLADRGERERCLAAVAAHLSPGGEAAFAIVERLPAPADLPIPLPDAREVDGWVYSSLPLETLVDGKRILVRRLRQVVSPVGELSEKLDEVSMRMLSAEGLEEEAEIAGLRPAGRREIAPTGDHVGSTVVLLVKESL